MSPPKRSGPVRGAAPESARRRDESILQRPAVTEALLTRALAAATIHDLAAAADPGYGQADLFPRRFRCPECRQTSAEVIDSLRWTCHGCANREDPFGTPWQPRSTVTGQRTIIELRRRVAEDYEFAERLVRQGRRATA